MPVSDPSAFLRPEEVLQKVGLRAEQVLVHLGCGAGFWLIPAAKIVGASGKAIGIDIRPDMLSEVENRARQERLGQTVSTARGDLEREGGSTLESNLADFVLIANIIHQADPVKLLTEGRRLLKPDGKVVVVEWDVQASPLGPPPAQRVAPEDMKKIAASLGLKTKEIFKASEYHYGLILQKTTNPNDQ